MVVIRPEAAGDAPRIRDVNLRAFKGAEEAALVDRLRTDRLVIASLVAEDAGTIVGHILLSRVVIRSPEVEIAAASLAPMAVVPERQHQGIGATLVRAGLEECRRKGERIVLVVGHPAYYPRFGFSHTRALNLRNRYSSGAAFMALELSPGALAGVSGDVVYPPAFDSLT